MKRVGALLLLLVGSGCANMPDATVGYYLAKTEVSVKLTRTIACDTSDQLFVQNAIVTTATHSADTSKVHSLSLKPLRGTFTDTDFTFEFYGDGRVKGVNSVSEGKGEDILKAAISVASTAAAMRSGKLTASTFADDCDYIHAKGDGKTLTIIYEATLRLDDRNSQGVDPDAASAPHVKRLEPRIGAVCAFVRDAKLRRVPLQKGDDAGAVLLKAREPALVALEVKGEAGCTRSLGASEVLVAQKGVDYEMPIPKAALFGKGTFVARFDDSGALNYVQYGSVAGAGQALNVINAGLTAVKDSSSAKAAQLDAESALIAAQQRLVRCRATPKDCS